MKINEWKYVKGINLLHTYFSSYFSISDVLHYNCVLKLRIRGKNKSFKIILTEVYMNACVHAHTHTYILIHTWWTWENQRPVLTDMATDLDYVHSRYSNFHSLGLIFIEVPWRDNINQNKHLLRTILTWWNNSITLNPEDKTHSFWTCKKPPKISSGVHRFVVLILSRISTEQARHSA